MRILSEIYFYTVTKTDIETEKNFLEEAGVK